MIVTHANSLLVVGIFWGAIVLIVFVSNFFAYRERTSRHRMIETLAEKGQPIPPELLAGGSRPYGWSGGYGAPDGYRYWQRHSLSGGIYMMCIGVALFVFLWALMDGSLNGMFGGSGNDFAVNGPSWLPFVAVFPFMVGVSRVLAWFFDRPRTPPAP